MFELKTQLGIVTGRKNSFMENNTNSLKLWIT
jgi:hypothetical protein